MKTIPEFLEALEKTPRTWRVNTQTDASGMVGRIRCGSGDTYQCPLSAVLGVTGVMSGRDYGKTLGLSFEDSSRIADSADDTGRYFDAELRKQLLTACGIQEPELTEEAE